MRGLGGMIAGALVGIVFAMLVRVLMGMDAWKAEPVWVVGAIFGVAGFMLGTGVMNDWLKWAKGEETPDHPESNPNLKGWAKILSVSYDHKVIGIQYGITSLILFMLAGTFALIFRTELAAARLAVPGPQDLQHDDEPARHRHDRRRSCWGSAPCPTTWCR